MTGIPETLATSSKSCGTAACRCGVAQPCINSTAYNKTKSLLRFQISGPTSPSRCVFIMETHLQTLSRQRRQGPDPFGGSFRCRCHLDCDCFGFPDKNMVTCFETIKLHIFVRFERRRFSFRSFDC